MLFGFYKVVYCKWSLLSWRNLW